MAEIGLQAYRLSISWPRVLPEGIGAVNKKGLDFYDKLIDALLAKKIEPWVTLFHWDYPYALFCRGGWLNPDSPDWFAEYSGVIADRLSDRVTHWMTQNEPQCFIGLGHQSGEHAPGLKLDFPQILQITHHALLAHGKSVQVLRSRAKAKPLIGAAPVGVALIPASDSKADIEAARKRMFSITEKHYWNNTWYAAPMIFGRFPEDGLAFLARRSRLSGDRYGRPSANLTTLMAPICIGLTPFVPLRTAAVKSCLFRPDPAVTTMGGKSSQKRSIGDRDFS
jgi:beta-glucosidase